MDGKTGDVSVVVPAAGESLRMGGDARKPFLAVMGEPIVVRTCRRLAETPGVFEIILVVHPDDLDSVQGEGWDALRAAGVELAVAGGRSRAESVWNGIQVVSARARIIAVHDAVRPFFPPDLARAVIGVARKRGGAIPVTPLTDTIKRVEGDVVVETPRRLGLMRVQTPQAFQSDLLIEAYEYAIRTGGLSEALTDDAQLVERLGREVAAVFGDELNIKITSPRDLRLAEALLKEGLTTWI
ncbi:MAG: 2-C-methyl-D-erythritol 4-phosphate cytidylyltransferase [Planctomycetota bacterium]|jgi:2-C-methyl-D-erythritol 4-phosphate cytidylyltransferase|nr:2-C-methyl-D-erythritol 4-phosphate cytidylyltransferase [Planctomycetota bacterium]